MFPRSSSNQTVSGNATGATSRRAFRDVSNANARNGANGKNGKPVVAKRSNGVKTRSMTIGNPNNNEIVLAPASRAGAAVAAAPSAREIFARGRAMADPNSYQITGASDDIDARDKEDPLCATEYVLDMYEYYREREIITSVRPTYMEAQPHINQRMRAILVDWLIEVHNKFKLVPETLYLTINLIDRYLEQEIVTRPKLQLIGVTALLIASKYEEIYPPELRDLVYICDRAYTRNEIVDAETRMLKTLDYGVTVPSAHAFLVRFLKAGHADKRIVQLSCWLLDGTCLSYDLLQYLPSQIAAAVVFLARRHVGRNGWSPTLLNYSQYCEEEIIPVARTILKAKQTTSSELRAVSKKYSASRFGQVASTQIANDF